jgi:hypothetical protein
MYQVLVAPLQSKWRAEGVCGGRARFDYQPSGHGAAGRVCLTALPKGLAVVDEIVTVEIPVQRETAEALADAHRVRAIGRLVDRLVHPSYGDDPLRSLLEETRDAAGTAGLTDQAVDAELDAFRAERAARKK